MLATRRLPSTGTRRCVLALCITVVVVTVLPVDTAHGSLWELVWHLPGATAIRAIDRIQVVGDLAAALALTGLATDALANWDRLRRSTALRVAGVALVCLIVLEQADTTGVSQLHRGRQLAALAAVPRPPDGCTSFYVVDAHPDSLKFYEYQTEAMLVSQRFGLPTLNGYSGDTPPGWGLLYPTTPSYPAQVQQWITSHGLLTGVCRLDLATSTWDTHPLPST